MQKLFSVNKIMIFACLTLQSIKTIKEILFSLLKKKNTVLGTQNVLVRIPVTVLEVGQSQTSIEGAISPEDSIVVQSTRSLEAGSKVRVKNENA